MKKVVLTLSLCVAGIGAYSQSTVWQPYNSNLDTSSYVHYLSVVDTNTVWGIGFPGSGTNPSSNKFTRTIDGANYHSGLFLPDTNVYAPSNISAVDANTAFIACYFKAATGASGKILKTTNGGATWANASDSLTMFAGANNFPDWVYFWDVNNGIALGDPNGNTSGGSLTMFEIWRTNNGGANWTRVVDANVPPPLSGEYGLTNSYTTWKGYIWSGTSDGNQVYASADSGKTWTVNSTALGLAGGIEGLAFRDSLNGLLWGSTSASASAPAVMQTTDGGNTWTNLTVDATVGTEAISRIPKTKGYMSVGLNGDASAYVTSVTYNDGASWTVLETGTTNAVRMLSVQMIDSLNGWAGCFSTDTLPYGTNGIDRFGLGHKLGCPITITTASGSTPFNVCAAGSATITASGLNTYTWSTSETTASITVTPTVTTSYSVAGTTTAGCANYETFNISIISPTVSVASHTICPGVHTTLHAGVGTTITYNWAPSTGLSATTGTTVTAFPTVATVYTITATEALCSVQNTFTFTMKPTPTVSISSSLSTDSLCSGSIDTLTASGANSYVWTSGPSTATYTVDPTVTTSYYVTGTGTNTCTRKDTITVIVKNCAGIERYSNNNIVSVYPNPSGGLVSVSLNNVTKGTYMYVTNMIGQEVYKASVKDLTTNIDISSLDKGVYMLTITDGQSKNVEKLIIQ